MKDEYNPRIVRAEVDKAHEVHYAEYLPNEARPGEKFVPIEATGWWGCAQWSKIELLCLN